MNLKQLLSEESLIDSLAKVAPWLTPILPATFTYHNLLTVMELSRPEAVIGGLVVEIFGLVSIHTANQFYQFNEENKERATVVKAPFFLMVIMALFYVAIVLLVNIFLDLHRPPVEIAARACLTLISVPAGVVLTTRYANQREKEKIEDNRVKSQTAVLLGLERKKTEKLTGQVNELSEKLDMALSERKDALSQLETVSQELEITKDAMEGLRQESRILTEQLTAMETKLENAKQPEPPRKNKKATSDEKLRWPDLPENEQKKIAGMTIEDVMETYSQERRTALNWIGYAEKMASKNGVRPPSQ